MALSKKWSLLAFVPCRNGEGVALVAALSLSHKPVAGGSPERSVTGNALPVDKDRVVIIPAFIEPSGVQAVFNERDVDTSHRKVLYYKVAIYMFLR